MFQFARYRRRFNNPFYLIIAIIGLCAAIEKMYESHMNPEYISCNSDEECVYYVENRKTKEKSKTKYFNSENIRFECSLYEPSWAKNKSGEYTHSYVSRGNVYWVLNLYASEKLVVTKDKYERKRLCEKDGAKYAGLIKKGNATFELK